MFEKYREKVVRYSSASVCLLVLLWGLSTSAALATAVIAIPTGEGVVVVADKLVTIANKKVDGFNKICPAGMHSIVASSGNLQSAQPNQIFDVNSLLAGFVVPFSESNTSLLPYCETIAQNIANRYEQYLKTFPSSKWLDLTDHRSGIAFKAMIWNYDADAKAYECMLYQCMVNPKNLVHPVSVLSTKLGKAETAHTQVMNIGADRVTMAILNRQGKYAGVSEEDWCQKFWFVHPATSTICADEAIYAGSKLLQLIHDDLKDSVGDHEDVLLLRNDGLDWKYQNKLASDVESRVAGRMQAFWILAILCVGGLFALLAIASVRIFRFLIAPKTNQPNPAKTPGKRTVRK